MAINYIKKIILENFQSHEYTELDLTPGLNMIVGPSDSGKTAIIRAIRWVLYNEPRGTEFMRQGATFCRVTLVMSNAYTIIRERSSSYNRYLLVDASGNRQVFEGFGNDIPVEVLKAHGIRKVVLDENNAVSINMGQQLEGPFMLMENGATRAKALGRLVGVHIIDRAMQGTITDITRLSQQIKQWDQDIANLDDAIKQYEYLPQLEKIIDESDLCITKAETLSTRLDKVIAIKQRLDITKNELEQQQYILNRLSQLNMVENLLHNIESMITHISSLTNIQQRLISTVCEIDYNNALLDKMADLNVAEDVVNKAIKLNEIMKNYIVLSNGLKIINADMAKQRNIINAMPDLDACYKNLKDASHKLELLKGLKSINKRLCSINDELSKALHDKSSLKGIEKCQALLQEAEKRIVLFGKLREIKTALQEINERIEQGKIYLNDLEVEVKNKAEEYGKLLLQTGKCPVCFSQINSDVIENIMASYEL